MVLLRDLMNRRDIAHEATVLAVSYAFIFAGAWNDGLLGFNPSVLSHVLEIATAALLAVEVTMRVRLASRRSAGFWALVTLDVAAILTVFPLPDWVTFARLGRMLYAALRLTRLLDRLAVERNNGMYVTAMFPFVVPVFAAIVFALERHAPGASIHNYGDALRVCFAFSLSLGNVRPTTDAAMTMCGAQFLLGLLTIGVLTNTISARYQDATEEGLKTSKCRGTYPSQGVLPSISRNDVHTTRR